MESIWGKRVVRLDASTLARQIAEYPHVLIDLGTGDGRFVRHVATTCRSTFAIGIDLCAANLREMSRRAPANALYLLANAYTPPDELRGRATHLVINFPWGDLLTGLLTQDARLPLAIAALCRPDARLEVRLNCGAITTTGWTLQDACTKLKCNLQVAGFDISDPRLLDVSELRTCPTTWAHRLAFGRDPRALYLHGLKRNKG